MTTYTQTAVFHAEKWNAAPGRSEIFANQNFNQWVADSFNRDADSSAKPLDVHGIFPDPAPQGRFKALLRSMMSRQKMKVIQDSSIADKVFPVEHIRSVTERMTLDLKSIASSDDVRNVCRISDRQIERLCHDIALLTEKGYLHCVDVSVLTLGLGKKVELKAYRFDVNSTTPKIRSNRPNGVFLSTQSDAEPALRIVLKYSAHYSRAAQVELEGQLQTLWQAGYSDISHSQLRADIDRDYSSHGYAIQRKVYS